MSSHAGNLTRQWWLADTLIYLLECHCDPSGRMARSSLSPSSNQGGMILEDTEIAIDKADSLASELCIVRPELRSRGCAVRVTDADSKEFYRTPVDLIPRG